MEIRENDALALWALEKPDDVAYRILESGECVTWKELELRSRQCAAMLLARGLKQGDCIAVFLDNHLRYFEILWAAQRIGLYYTTISRHLKTNELLYILGDCGAKALFTSQGLVSDVGALVQATGNILRFTLGGSLSGFSDYESALATVQTDVQLAPAIPGTDFSYSSGTTGRPKGIKRPLEHANQHFNARPGPQNVWKQFDRNSVFLSTAPFYHTAPVRWNMAVMMQGGSCVMMQKFNEKAALNAIEQYRVTHSQWVPTMFIRLLRLPLEERASHDLSSMRYAIHAAAPCPVWVKEQMIAWWGPILYEFYSGTELVGRTSLNSDEWMAHKGSVGRPEFGAVHIVDESGNECGTGERGLVYFSGGPRFEYHNDPDKTREAYNDRGWGTYGDIGYVDEDGYLYLTDRVANTIISGGVNIYPQEAENVILRHPKVQDVAVIGSPNEEFGEEVKAVVELLDPDDATAELATEIIALCRADLSAIKCPRSVDFVTDLPRTDAGKLLKREVKARYWK